MASERTHLISPTILDTLPGSGHAPQHTSHAHRNYDSKSQGLGATNPSINDIPRGRTDTIFTNSDVHPENINELLVMLERATGLVRQHAQSEEELTTTHKTSRPLIPRWVTNYLIIITFTWQALNVGIMEVIYSVHTSNKTREDLDLSSDIVMTIFQAAHLILVFFVSFKLAKQVIHRTASGSLLAQCYLSTVLLFAGLYTLVYRFHHNAWENVKYTFTETEPRPVLLFTRMLYFSVSTATLCGTSAVEPVQWYASLTVSVQMLMSFVYFTSILALGVVPRKRSKYHTPSGPMKSFTKLCRRCCFKEPA